MRPVVARVLSELRKPADARSIGHDRDPMGLIALVSPLTRDEQDAHADVIMAAQMPAKVDCVTCRFQGREWAGEPCHSCLDDYTTARPYPKWRRAEGV